MFWLILVILNDIFKRWTSNEIGYDIRYFLPLNCMQASICYLNQVFVAETGYVYDLIEEVFMTYPHICAMERESSNIFAIHEKF